MHSGPNLHRKLSSVRRDALPQKPDHRCRHLLKMLYLVRGDFSRLNVIRAQRTDRLASYHQARGRVHVDLAG